MTIPESNEARVRISPPWLLLKEPKVISALWGGLYTIFALVGVMFVLFLSESTIVRYGLIFSFTTGALLLLGGTSALLSLHSGQWFLERAGIYLNIGGLTCYIVTVFVTNATITAIIIRSFFAFALILVMLIRFYTIRGLTLDPKK